MTMIVTGRTVALRPFDPGETLAGFDPLAVSAADQQSARASRLIAMLGIEPHDPNVLLGVLSDGRWAAVRLGEYPTRYAVEAPAPAHTRRMRHGA